MLVPCSCAKAAKLGDAPEYSAPWRRVVGSRSGRSDGIRPAPSCSGGWVGPPGTQHRPSPLLMRVQHFVLAAADTRLQNLDASHQAQLPSELMRIERALCLAPAFGEMPHARESDRLAVPIRTLQYGHGASR
jgi:hypothetical protein